MEALIRDAIADAIAEKLGQEGDTSIALAITERVVETLGDRIVLAIETQSALASGTAASEVDRAIDAISKKIDRNGEVATQVVERLVANREEHRAIMARIDSDMSTWASDAQARAGDLRATSEGLKLAGNVGLFGDVIETLDEAERFLRVSARYALARAARASLTAATFASAALALAA